MASGFRETNRALSKALQEQARLIGVFDHPTAKGDGREDLLRDYLRERVGSTFGVTKAEVVDSLGNTSGELDVVIYDQRVASCLAVHGERRIVRAEAVAVTIEVKSVFKAASAMDEATRIREGIGALRRFYRPSALLRPLIPTMGVEHAAEANALFSEGISTLDDLPNAGIPSVVSAYFAFDGPTLETVGTFVDTPLIDALCVLGRYTIARKNVGINKRADAHDDARGYIWSQNDDALGAFLHVIEGALDRALDSRLLVHPSPRAYYSPPRFGPQPEPLEEGATDE